MRYLLCVAALLLTFLSTPAQHLLNADFRIKSDTAYYLADYWAHKGCCNWCNAQWFPRWRDTIEGSPCIAWSSFVRASLCINVDTATVGEPIVSQWFSCVVGDIFTVVMTYRIDSTLPEPALCGGWSLEYGTNGTNDLERVIIPLGITNKDKRKMCGWTTITVPFRISKTYGTPGHERVNLYLRTGLNVKGAVRYLQLFKQGENAVAPRVMVRPRVTAEQIHNMLFQLNGRQQSERYSAFTVTLQR